MKNESEFVDGSIFLHECELLRKEGNEFYEKKEYQKSIEIYEKAIAKFDEKTLEFYEKHKKHIENYVELSNMFNHRCFLNISLCLIKLEKFNEALSNIQQVLENDQKNEKALRLKAHCHEMLNEFDEAKKVYEILLNLGNLESKTKLDKLQQKRILFDKKLSGLYSNLFSTEDFYQDKETMTRNSYASSNNSVWNEGFLNSWKGWVFFLVLALIVLSAAVYISLHQTSMNMTTLRS